MEAHSIAGTLPGGKSCASLADWFGSRYTTLFLSTAFRHQPEPFEKYGSSVVSAVAAADERRA